MTCQILFANAAKDIVINLDKNSKPLTYRTALESVDKLSWITAAEEEFNRLIDSTKTMELITKENIPKGRQISYYNPQVKIKIKNDVKTFRVRGTYGGNLSDYDGEVAARTAELLTVKCLINSTVARKRKLLFADIVDFYLGSIMTRPEYMFVLGKQIPENTKKKLGIVGCKDDEKIYFKINKGIYGLRQAGKLAQDQLFDHLKQHGFTSCQNTPCLFKHATRDIMFCLVVDDFGISYNNKEDVEYLISVIEKKYKLTVDWEGKKYLGMTIEQDLKKETITLSMPGYVQKALVRFNITKSKNDTNSPSIYIKPEYGKQAQLDTIDPNAEPVTDPKFKKLLQQVVGVFLYYARAVDPTMLTSLSKLASQQANPTQSTVEALNRFLLHANKKKYTSKGKVLFRVCDACVYVGMYSHHQVLPLEGARQRGQVDWQTPGQCTRAGDEREK